jgi:hypothetical protein
MFMLCSGVAENQREVEIARENSSGRFTQGVESDSFNPPLSKPWRVKMRVKVREIGPGLHPSEVVVEIKAVGGSERLVVDRKSIQNGTIFAGWRPLSEKKGQWLVELPRETMSGTWRVWVRRDQIEPESQEAMRA